MLRLPPAWLDLMRVSGQAGADMGLEVYVVGGFVRDLLLGLPPHMDLDLVVEGPGLDYAHALARRLQARVRTHERFQTANLFLPDGQHVDVATARTETYCRPAALPAVSGSTLKQDLFRRDFSINALAMRLHPDSLGQVVDYFGARRDLDSGIIRVLHNHSFVDDPIRILRAIRFEQRLHFRLEAGTEHLLRSAVHEGMLGHATAERIRDEFLACLSEPAPIPVLKRLEQLRILRAVHPSLHMDKRVIKTMEEVAAVRERLSPWLPELEMWRLYLRVLVSRLRPAEVESMSRTYRLSLPSTQADMANLIRLLSRPKLYPSQLENALSRLDPEELVFLACLGARAGQTEEPVVARILAYLGEVRNTPPLVSGHHLRQWGYPPGPAYKPMLAAVRAAQLDGHVASLEEARRWLEHKFAGSAQVRAG